ncbi:kynureninase [Sphingomonas sp. LY160]|uniref:kynureninase n=1 Tax=Sphingomonas sp. LY160 TaxID=3095342 RepID=UPI002ADEB307|nr:kynureninase [Sphingomonas sp. LY160]MEA1073202.1 kynureninase [Sphingomonas sp. LY160]
MTLDEAKARDAADPLRHCRDRFALPDGIIYLDGNSLGALPRSTAPAVADLVERQWGEHLITSWNRHGWIEAPRRLSAKLAPLIGAAPTEIAVCDSTSVNLFKLLAAVLSARPGRRTILTEADNFPTDLYIAEGVVGLFPDTNVKAVERGDLEAALDDDVAVLMLTHVDYRSGARYDMAALSAAATSTGALSLWDLSHSAGALALDLDGSGADLAVGCGYKYLNGGPGAPAFLFVADRHQAEMSSPIRGWMGHAAPFAFDADYQPVAGIDRFLAGTPSIVAMTGLEQGIDSFADLDMSIIEEKAAALTDFFIHRVSEEAPSLALASPRRAEDRGSHVSFRHPDAYAVMQALIASGVIGDVRMPDLIRFGFAPLYNGFVDAWRAAAILGEVIAKESWRDPAYEVRAAVI